ncbi:MAG: exodeoxyribonuclease V subunit alpha [Deferribacterales bacterium]
MNTADVLYENGQLRDIDVQFAKQMCAVFGCPDAYLFFAVLFYAVSTEHTCLKTDRIDILPFYKDFKEELDNTFSDGNIQKIAASGAVAKDESAPVIFTGGRLYLAAFYRSEKLVGDFIRQSPDIPIADGKKLKDLLIKEFGEGANMQKAAALCACLSGFCVITGGPGTGKTTTVRKVLNILNALSDSPLNIALTAPTGKAANRLNETLTETDGLKAVTLHRLLGTTGSRDRSRFSPEYPMAYDVVIVDEASMVDLKMMSELVNSLKPAARLILLGDKDQLSSVMPGSVLGDICTASETDVFSQERALIIEEYADTKVSPQGQSISDITVALTESHRFDDTLGIGKLAKACRVGDSETAIEVIRSDTTGKIDFIPSDTDIMGFFRKYIIDLYRKTVSESDPQKMLEMAARSIILCPTVTGRFGTQAINGFALSALSREGLRSSTEKYFHGQPVMITENDYSMNLFNGETGLIVKQDGMKAYFAGRERPAGVMRMPSWVNVYAMTVHKSQGSEFDHVILVLPESESPIATRELFYTAVTRAKEKLTVISTETAIRSYLNRQTERFSGLEDYLRS